MIVGKSVELLQEVKADNGHLDYKVEEIGSAILVSVESPLIEDVTVNAEGDQVRLLLVKTTPTMKDIMIVLGYILGRLGGV